MLCNFVEVYYQFPSSGPTSAWATAYEFAARLSVTRFACLPGHSLRARLLLRTIGPPTALRIVLILPECRRGFLLPGVNGSRGEEQLQVAFCCPD